MKKKSVEQGDEMNSPPVKSKSPLGCEELYGPYPSNKPVPFVPASPDKPKAASKTSNAEEKKEQEPPKAPPHISGIPADYRDVDTPDEWIPRDGNLIRLTGRHPMNSEPPLALLDKYNFITPVPLHVVRNHGAVPNLSWEEHKLVIGGSLVPLPLELSMDELESMSSREFPVTISCCGNRRKEINMIKQSIGFSWGAAGVATNVFKGVLVRDLLLKAGVGDDDVDGKHVEFVGFEDLPNKVGPGPFSDERWGKKVKYGTSIPLGRAMSPAFDVIVAYEANGERLQPDHGYPIRLIIPGYIGGRMVKWLKQINVIRHESHNHFHYHDNKYLPPQIDAEEALRGGWWYKQEYIINELSLNSVITRPDHDETLPIASKIQDTFEIAGYAHTGGGRRITRVEITLDGGTTWEVAEIHRKERPNEYGFYWCWIWWTYNLSVAALVGCEEIWVRAWDDANNPQPTHPTWSLMGQNCNHVFRVKVHTDIGGGDAPDEHVFRFEHPTQPGQQPGGWATRVTEKFTSAGFGPRITY